MDQRVRLWVWCLLRMRPRWHARAFCTQRDAPCTFCVQPSCIAASLANGFRRHLDDVVSRIRPHAGNALIAVRALVLGTHQGSSPGTHSSPSEHTPPCKHSPPHLTRRHHARAYIGMHFLYMPRFRSHVQPRRASAWGARREPVSCPCFRTGRWGHPTHPVSLKEVPTLHRTFLDRHLPIRTAKAGCLGAPEGPPTSLGT